MKNPPDNLCERCRRQPATVHLTQTIRRLRGACLVPGAMPPSPAALLASSTGLPEQPGDVQHTHLCEACAAAVGVTPPAR